MKKIIQEIISNYEIPLLNNTNPSLGDIEQFYNILENRNVIHFGVRGRETFSGVDYWLQTEYYCEKLGYIIIIDFSIPVYYKTIDDIVTYIENINKEIEIINTLIRSN